MNSRASCRFLHRTRQDTIKLDGVSGSVSAHVSSHCNALPCTYLHRTDVPCQMTCHVSSTQACTKQHWTWTFAAGCFILPGLRVSMLFMSQSFRLLKAFNFAEMTCSGDLTPYQLHCVLLSPSQDTARRSGAGWCVKFCVSTRLSAMQWCPVSHGCDLQACAEQCWTSTLIAQDVCVPATTGCFKQCIGLICRAKCHVLAKRL